MRDVTDATKKPNRKRKSGIEGRYLTETRDITVAKDVDIKVRRPKFEDPMLLKVGELR